jgi:protein-L-isoaspartate(D-aspartate) O-methyltransferase
MDKLIESLIKKEVLKTPRIVEAFQKIDRADFVPEELKHQAYINEPLPIGFGQTISQPYTVAFMLELLKPEPGNKILDIGSGSCWQTALLAEIVGPPAGGGKVIAIERIKELCNLGQENIKKYSFLENGRVELYCRDGTKGFSKAAPFDRIITAAATDKPSQEWLNQLKTGGRLVAPFGSSVWLYIKEAENKFKKKEHFGFAFVPLISDN